MFASFYSDFPLLVTSNNTFVKYSHLVGTDTCAKNVYVMYWFIRNKQKCQCVGCQCVGCQCVGCQCVGCQCVGCQCVGCQCVGCQCVGCGDEVV